MVDEIRCEVLVTGLEVMADIGVLDRERGVLQPLLISVAVTIAPPPEDDLAETIDYVAIRDAAHALAAERTVLVETYARRLAARCLDDARTISAEVRVDKPHALTDGLAGTRVRLTAAGRKGATTWTG